VKKEKSSHAERAKTAKENLSELSVKKKFSRRECEDRQEKS